VDVLAQKQQDQQSRDQKDELAACTRDGRQEPARARLMNAVKTVITTAPIQPLANRGDTKADAYSARPPGRSKNWAKKSASHKKTRNSVDRTAPVERAAARSRKRRQQSGDTSDAQDPPPAVSLKSLHVAPCSGNGRPALSDLAIAPTKLTTAQCERDASAYYDGTPRTAEHESPVYIRQHSPDEGTNQAAPYAAGASRRGAGGGCVGVVIVDPRDFPLEDQLRDKVLWLSGGSLDHLRAAGPPLLTAGQCDEDGDLDHDAFRYGSASRATIRSRLAACPPDVWTAGDLDTAARRGM